MFRILLLSFIVFSVAGCGSKNAKKKINEDEKTDPRWDELKKLLTDK